MGYKTGGGEIKFYLYKKCVCMGGGEAENVLAMLKGGEGGGAQQVLRWF